MAEIPVERKQKSAFPMWLIPLLLLLLLLPLLYFTCGRNNNVAVVDNTNANRALGSANNGNSYGSITGANGSTTGANNSAVAAGNTAIVTNANGNANGVGNSTTAANANNPAAAGGTVTAVNYFGTVKDKSTIVGRNVDLRTARVSRVLSDRVFTVRSEGEEMFVMLDENLDSPGGKEGQIKIRAGQNVKLAGAFRSVPTTGEVGGERQGGGLNQKEYAQMKNQQVYLHATGVEDAR